MPSKSQLIATLREMATLLELDGANTFKVGAYPKAARALEDEQVDVESRVESGTLTDIDGIGKGLAEKITEFWREGRIKEMEELRQKFPAGLLAMTEIQGFGAKKTRQVYDELGIDSIEALEKACEEGTVAKLKGFGEKTQVKILDGIALMRKHSGRFRIDVARRAAVPILDALRNHKAVKQAEVAGSLRRWKETVKDVDIVCATDSPEEVMDFFVGLAGVDSIVGKGKTKTSVRMDNGLGVDLRCVSVEQYPFALAHFTGSKEHNVRLRQLANDKGLKLNEYGLFPNDSDKSLAAKSEQDIHKHLDLAEWVAPELREDMGEVEAALEGKLPRLVTAEDIVGILHMHTHYSDGKPTLEEYAAWAAANNVAWMGIADHSKTASYAGGLTVDDLREQWAEIDLVNAESKKKKRKAVLLKGIESDILGDGALDYDDDILEQFDFIVASVHSRFSLPKDEQTRRLIKAVENKYTTVLGHMTGRLILQRDGYEIDHKEVIAACAANGVAIEINANPRRLDMDWRWVHHALDKGCFVSIGPDAHVMDGLKDMEYGIGIARKGWVTKDDCVNCWSMDKFLNHARRNR